MSEPDSGDVSNRERQKRRDGRVSLDRFFRVLEHRHRTGCGLTDAFEAVANCDDEPVTPSINDTRRLCSPATVHRSYIRWLKHYRSRDFADTYVGVENAPPTIGPLPRRGRPKKV
jgi:hypothetical protein